ncbi:MAG: protein phosphatase 2C domain-containing protein, partial [Novipirellula sp. JB048]
MLSTLAESALDFCIESDMREPRSLAMPSGSVVSVSRRCPGKAEPNDDSSVVIRTSGGAIVMAVADGVGGCPLGYKASAIAVHCIAEKVSEVDPVADLRPAILDGIEKANAEILELGVGAATTLSVVEIVERRVRAYTV